jgi:hypothetical protein
MHPIHGIKKSKLKFKKRARINVGRAPLHTLNNCSHTRAHIAHTRTHFHVHAKLHARGSVADPARASAAPAGAGQHRSRHRQPRAGGAVGAGLCGYPRHRPPVVGRCRRHGKGVLHLQQVEGGGPPVPVRHLLTSSDANALPVARAA